MRGEVSEFFIAMSVAMGIAVLIKLYRRRANRCCHRVVHYSLWCRACDGALCEWHARELVQGVYAWRVCARCYAKSEKEGDA